MTSAASPPAAPLGLVRNVQALRALAALLVVFVHAALPDVGVDTIFKENAWLTPFRYIGLFGVDLFFTISGFIMLVTNWNNFARPAASARFFLRRVIRIYPPYWFALLPVLVVLIVAKDRFMGSHVGVSTGFVQSFLLLPNPDKFVLTVGWTLVWEVLFYVVFAGMLRFERKILAVLLVGWLAVEIVMYATLSGAQNFYLHFASTPLPIEFILGVAIGILYVKRIFPAPRTVLALGIVVTTFMWTMVARNAILLENPNDMNRILIFGLSAAVLVYAAVVAEEALGLVAPRPVVAVGDGSYAMYLWHLSILVVIRKLVEHSHWTGTLAHAVTIASTTAIVIASGMLIYRFVEKPMTAYLNGLLSKRIRLPRVEPAAAGLTRIEAAVEP